MLATRCAGLLRAGSLSVAAMKRSRARKPSKILTENQQHFTFSRRAFFLGGVQLGIGGLLAARMGWISIAQNEKYSLQSESNRVNLTLTLPRRGWIVDRHGLPLALNKTSFRVDVIPDRLTNPDQVLNKLATLMRLTETDVARVKSDVKKAAGFQPVMVAEQLDYETFAAVSLRSSELPGVAPSQFYTRFYPDGASVGHLVGYVGAASAKQYEESRDPLLITPGFKVGKEGLEKTLETEVRGAPGAKRTEVTARGRLVRELATKPDTPGRAMKLTIDAGLQAYATRRMGDQAAALVCIDCNDGDILAMASMPCYDPNIFSDGISRDEWDMFAADDHLPLINKSLQGLYPPGSTSKPMTSLALLKAGIDPNETVYCSGAYKVGGSFFHCSQRRGHGAISMHEAIIKSCDIYFYHFGIKAGIGAIAPMARQLGLGEKFDLPVASQRYGTVPDVEWLLRKYKKQWSTFDTVNTSIGQGYVLVNPLQLALMTARIASGRHLTPRLLASQKRVPAPPLSVSLTDLAFVRDAMGGVINSGRGTASGARLPVDGVKMAGKTGTAQVRRISMAERARGVRSNASLAWKQRDHSLFIAFAPADAPRYAIGCIVEHGGAGASAAAPLVRDTMTYLFDPAKAMASLEAQEAGWGGDIKTRMARKTAAWKAAKNPKPVDPGSVDDAEVTKTVSEASERQADHIGTSEPVDPTPEGDTPKASPEPLKPTKRPNAALPTPSPNDAATSTPLVPATIAPAPLPNPIPTP
jgi:penicillin-binding protein 2